MHSVTDVLLILFRLPFQGPLTGSVFIYPVAGLLCKYGIDGKGFDGGWPAIFYIFGEILQIRLLLINNCCITGLLLLLLFIFVFHLRLSLLEII